MKIKYFFLYLFVLVLLDHGFVSSVHAQALSQGAFTSKARAMEKDKFGTKTGHIKVFELNADKKKIITEGPYTVKLYIDGKYYHKYDNARMPFEFKQNFKGLSAGTHTFKVEIVDGTGNVISAEESYIDVSGNESQMRR